MNRSLSILSILLTATASAVAAQEADYTRGIIWVNEDWYGHQNSTVNYLMPDDPEGNFWKYRIIQAENPGKELGCTNQYGAIWNDRIYLIAKQDKDPGATITGGRITVADAKTMKILHQQSLIDPSGSQWIHFHQQWCLDFRPRVLHCNRSGRRLCQPHCRRRQRQTEYRPYRLALSRPIRNDGFCCRENICGPPAIRTSDC